VLANSPGFRTLYTARDVEFEEGYADIIDRAFRPILRGPHDARCQKLLRIIQADIEGKVIQKEEYFFLKNKQGELEFTLLAEGLRKLALLWLLIQNGSLLDGSVLFWDEPEANLNPKKIGTLVEVLLELQRMGVLLATHNYVLLKRNSTCGSRPKTAFASMLSTAMEIGESDRLRVTPNTVLDGPHN